MARDATHGRVRLQDRRDRRGLQGVDVEGRLQHEDAGVGLAELVEDRLRQRRVGARSDFRAAVERDL